MQIQFIAKIHKFDYGRLAVYIPRSAIEFYFPGIDLKQFGTQYHDDQFFYRISIKDEWEFAGGYLGYYGSRNTLRLLFVPYGKDNKELIGKVVQFCIKFDLGGNGLHILEIKKNLYPEVVQAEKEQKEKEEDEKWQRIIDHFKEKEKEHNDDTNV